MYSEVPPIRQLVEPPSPPPKGGGLKSNMVLLQKPVFFSAFFFFKKTLRPKFQAQLSEHPVLVPDFTKIK